MISRLSTILKLAFVLLTATVYQSCDSTLNIEKPKTYMKYIGADGDQTGVDMVTDDDGNIYILGTSGVTPEVTQVYIVKTSSEGIVQWEQTYGNGGEDIPVDLEMLSTGSLVAAANKTDKSNGEKSIVVYAISSTDGTMTASRVIDTPGVAEFVNSITPTLAGGVPDGFVIAGYNDIGGVKHGLTLRVNAALQDYAPEGSWTSNLDQLGNTPGDEGYDIVPVKIVQVSASLFYTFGYTNSIKDDDNIADYNFFINVTSGQNDLLNNTFFIRATDATSDEKLSAVKQVPSTQGGGFILTGYISTPGIDRQDLYMARVVQDLTTNGGAIASQPGSYLYHYPNLQPAKVTSGLSSVSSTAASVFPSEASGFLILSVENSSGNNNIFLTKVKDTFENAWSDPYTSHVFGGIGNDQSGVVLEAGDGSILVCGSMTLGEVNGQSKIVLMRLNQEGMFGD